MPQQHSGQRSRSFDSAGSDDSNAAAFLEVPKRFHRRRSSNSKTPPPCIHCQYLEEYERAVGAEQRYFIDHNEVKSLSYSDVSSSDEDDDDNYGEDGAYNGPHFGALLIPPPISSCNIKFVLSPTNGDNPPFPDTLLPLDSPPATRSIPSSPTIEFALFDDPPVPMYRARRRSISRQEAVFVEPTGSSLENVADVITVPTDKPPEDNSGTDCTDTIVDPTDLVQDIYLTVPDLKRDRAASVDSCFSKVPTSGKTEELQLPDGGLTLTVPSNATRSRSVDIVLPTDEQARYKALAMAGPAGAAYMLKGYVFRSFWAEQIRALMKVQPPPSNISFYR